MAVAVTRTVELEAERKEGFPLINAGIFNANITGSNKGGIVLLASIKKLWCNEKLTSAVVELLNDLNSLCFNEFFLKTTV